MSRKHHEPPRHSISRSILGFMVDRKCSADQKGIVEGDEQDEDGSKNAGTNLHEG